MTSDNRDKTVFKQSGGGADRTVIRPAPGGRGRGASPPNPSAAPDTMLQPPRGNPQMSTQYRDDLAQTPPLQGGNLMDRVQIGLNPIVNAASTLIAVLEKTRGSMSNANVGGLHQRLSGEIRRFEQQLKDHGIKPEIVLSARYAICAALDEAVLNTPWGADSPWPQRTLLSLFHNETSGGEKFFRILERMLEYPAENTDMLEFMYVLLSLGFEGKYRVIERGRDMIETMRDNLFRVIRTHRGEFERSLSPSWQGLGSIRNSLASYIPLWVVASVLGVVLVLSYSAFRVWMFETSEPVVQRLEKIAEYEPETR